MKKLLIALFACSATIFAAPMTCKVASLGLNQSYLYATADVIKSLNSDITFDYSEKNDVMTVNMENKYTGAKVKLAASRDKAKAPAGVSGTYSPGPQDGSFDIASNDENDGYVSLFFTSSGPGLGLLVYIGPGSVAIYDCAK